MAHALAVASLHASGKAQRALPRPRVPHHRGSQILGSSLRSRRADRSPARLEIAGTQFRCLHVGLSSHPSLCIALRFGRAGVSPAPSRKSRMDEPVNPLAQRRHSSRPAQVERQPLPMRGDRLRGTTGPRSRRSGSRWPGDVPDARRQDHLGRVSLLHLLSPRWPPRVLRAHTRGVFERSQSATAGYQNGPSSLPESGR
jgi:hypothetical protein